MSIETVDIVIVGSGIAGAALAANLPEGSDIVVVEGESTPGFHATGRSAALFSNIYGNPLIRALSRTSQAFLCAPPAGFSDVPLVTPRGLLYVARPDQLSKLEEEASSPDVAAFTNRLSGQQAMELCGALKPGHFAAALHEPDALDLDVNALHMGFIRMAKAKGVRFVTSSPVVALTHVADMWDVITPTQTYRARIVVNAAGAWADEVAALAGARTRGIVPKRRTMVLVDTSGEPLSHDAPMVVDMDEQFYFKPESGGVLLSPADETPVSPCDVQPEELDIAIAIDRVETATNLAVRRIRSSWAGLRTFAADKSPVVGFDPDVPNFFLLAGQGGYGIQTAPALGELAAALVSGRQPRAETIDQGVSLEEMLPGRPALTALPELC